MAIRNAEIYGTKNEDLLKNVDVFFTNFSPF
jgi:hypothetical protein